MPKIDLKFTWLVEVGNVFIGGLKGGAVLQYRGISFFGGTDFGGEGRS